MRSITALVLIAVATVSAWAQSPSSSSGKNLSPAEQSISQAEKLIAKNSKDFEAFNALALALSRRARETSDVQFYAQAEEALQRSFEISPGNFDGERTHVWLLLGKHEFAAALEAAKKLNKKMPDDVMLYGFLTDANVELGNYKDAEAAAQWMLDLRPGSIPSLTRAAYLRELFGDIDGALDLMQMAYQSTPPSESEDRAWIITQMAHLNLATGETSQAEKLLQQALAIFPGYHYADHANESAKALEVAKREYASRHDVYTLDAYAWALYVNGRFEEARKQIEAALEAGIRDAKLFGHAGEIALKSGDRAKAQEYLSQSAELNTIGSELAREQLALIAETPIGQ